MAKYIFGILPVGLCSSVCLNQKSQKRCTQTKKKRDELYGALLLLSLSFSLHLSMSLILNHTCKHYIIIRIYMCKNIKRNQKDWMTLHRRQQNELTDRVLYKCNAQWGAASFTNQKEAESIFPPPPLPPPPTSSSTPTFLLDGGNEFSVFLGRNNC